MSLRMRRFTVFICVLAVCCSVFPQLAARVHADSGATGTCVSNSHADAASYDGVSNAAADGGVTAGGYTLDNCVGLGQTDAVFTAGAACQNAGIAPGGEHGVGYAVVTWLVVWVGDQGGYSEVGPVRQQYDCGDTFF